MQTARGEVGAGEIDSGGRRLEGMERWTMREDVGERGEGVAESVVVE